jgi:hypothetical protein
MTIIDMKQKSFFFTPYNMHGLEGYYINVRNSFNNQLEQEFIPEKAKSLYESKFGQTVITDNEFLDWYAANAKNFQ